MWQWERQEYAFMCLLCCVYVWMWPLLWSECDRGLWSTHGQPAQILIISPRDISGSSVPCAGVRWHGAGTMACSGKCLLGRGQVTSGPGLTDHYLEAIRPLSLSSGGTGARCQIRRHQSEPGLFVAMILPCDRNKTRIGSGTPGCAGITLIHLWLWVFRGNLLTCPNILIFRILDYRILN